MANLCNKAPTDWACTRVEGHEGPCAAIHVPACDFEITSYNSGGTGGMLVGMDIGVKVTHLPSGLVTTASSERSQHRNKLKAWNEMLVKLRYWHPHKQEVTMDLNDFTFEALDEVGVRITHPKSGIIQVSTHRSTAQLNRQEAWSLIQNRVREWKAKKFNTLCPTCGAPCHTTINPRGGDYGWGTTDKERTTYKYVQPVAKPEGPANTVVSNSDMNKPTQFGGYPPNTPTIKPTQHTLKKDCLIGKAGDVVTAHWPELPDETTAMNRTRELAESGRWPSDWVEAYQRGYSDRAASAPADSESFKRRLQAIATDRDYWREQAQKADSVPECGSNTCIARQCTNSNHDPADTLAGAMHTSRAHAIEVMRDAVGKLEPRPELLWDAFIEEWKDNLGIKEVVNLLGGHDKLKAVFLKAAGKVKDREAMGEAYKMPGTPAFTMAVFFADKVPPGTKLYKE